MKYQKQPKHRSQVGGLGSKPSPVNFMSLPMSLSLTLARPQSPQLLSRFKLNYSAMAR